METTATKRIVKTFHEVGGFQSCRAAEEWCELNGISVGIMQGPAPRGLMYGDCHISKWRNLSHVEQKQMHGTMTGDMRNGPVVVNIREKLEGEKI